MEEVMAWVYLLIAGIFEWGWPVGLKLAFKNGVFSLWPAVGAAVSMGASGLFLYLAQRTLPIGTAYAVWTGIGAVGTFVLGILIFKEPATAMRMVCVGTILAGIVGLKLTSP
jgi:quaternary ammonium compound-resistance protein SugE